MKKIISLLALMIIGCLSTLASCKKEKLDNKKTLKVLYKTYEDGKISKCHHNGKTIYVGELNAYDAGSSVYDKDGHQIGSCNYAWGQIDPICHELQDCLVIYRVEDNIWGQSAVDILFK